MVTTVDGHSGGLVERVVTGGAPYVFGSTMLEKMEYARKNLDSFRTFLVKEPRGHSAMFAALLTQPTVEEADVGVLYLGQPRYDPMCGHGTIVTCTVLVETGIVEVEEPRTKVFLDTPAGIVRAEVAVKDGSASSVTLQNVPSFLYKGDAEVDVPGLGEVSLDIAYGGVFYAIVPADSVQLEIKPNRRRDIVSSAFKIWKAVNEQIDVQHPEKPEIRGVSLVQFSSEATNPKATAKNAVVWYPPGDVDRSPCGTGTCAKMAALHAKGKLHLGEEFIHESIIGSLYMGKLIKETMVGSYRAVVPSITGSASITGFHQFVLDPEDPFPSGFEFEVE